MDLNEEYKSYFTNILENVLNDLLVLDEEMKVIDYISPKLRYKIDYISHRISVNNENPVEFDHGYETYNEWKDIPEVYYRLLGYNDWLKNRRDDRIRKIC